MSTWVSPATFVSAAVLTAAQLNATRDNLTFLKGALDLITNSTTADTGTATALRITRTSTNQATFESMITGDTVARLRIESDGDLNWGPGSGATDTNLYRVAANFLATDDNFLLNGSYVNWVERADPTAPAANEAYLYVRDNGSGKSQLVILFNTGAVQIIATQP